MMPFKTVNSSLLFSRRDPADPRLGELLQAKDASHEVAILGYPDDEGIRLNGGREGAASGPAEIRRWLYRMTPHPQRRLRASTDYGDMEISGELGTRHEGAALAVSKCLAADLRVLSLGGGNDYAYADGIAFLRQYENAKPLVINVDAHFDVRPVSDRGLNSGTPFYRLLESGLKFDFVEFGIQAQCNARAHWDYVKAKGGHILTMEDYLCSGLSLLEFSQRTFGDLLLQSRPCYLAIDIDAFALPFAPGASSSWPLGLNPAEFYPVFLTWLKRWNVRVMGIYEVSPALDSSSATAKWAAQLAHGFLHDV